MADPDFSWHGRVEAPNYTMAPNVYFDEISPRLSGNEVKIMNCLLRHTFGYHRDSARLSLSQLEERAGVSRAGVKTAVVALIRVGLVGKEASRVANGSAGANVYFVLIASDARYTGGRSDQRLLDNSQGIGQKLAYPPGQKPAHPQARNWPTNARDRSIERKEGKESPLPPDDENDALAAIGAHIRGMVADGPYGAFEKKAAGGRLELGYLVIEARSQQDRGWLSKQLGAVLQAAAVELGLAGVRIEVGGGPRLDRAAGSGGISRSEHHGYGERRPASGRNGACVVEEDASAPASAGDTGANVMDEVAVAARA